MSPINNIQTHLQITVAATAERYRICRESREPQLNEAVRVDADAPAETSPVQVLEREQWRVDRAGTAGQLHVMLWGNGTE